MERIAGKNKKKKLHKRRRPLHQANGTAKCLFCGSVLERLIDYHEDYEKFGYCSKCDDWFWIPNLFKNELSLTINPEKEETEEEMRISSLELRKRMEHYHQIARKRLTKGIKIYTADQYNQEFLKSLIPKG